jgi:Flp pilus assembly CpaF family ATPase
MRGPASQTGEQWQLDWDLVRTFRQTASQQLAAELRDRPGVDEETRRELGRDVIHRLLADHNQTEASSGRGLIDVDSEAVLAQAIIDALFGLGRLQPLVDDPDIENIEVTGHDQVRLIYADGRIEVGPPVADSDEELIDFLAFLAARRGEAERPFGFANPRLHLALPGRARLTAAAWITQRPTIRIRRQRLTNITLTELHQVGSISHTLAAFLHAAVHARRSIVVAGEMGSGKTTMVRALAAAIPPYESIATLETEYELYLDELPQRQLRPVEAWEARPGSGERGPDGRPAGAITLEDVFEDVLRHNLDRVIVGEVRGAEAMAMFKCMQAGAGSLSTIHARNARDTIGRLVTCVVAANVPEAYAHRLVAQNVDLIVHLSARVDPRTGQRRRHVAEVIEVNPGEEGRPATNQLFAPGPDGRATPRHSPSEQLLTDLEAAGFRHELLDSQDGWTPQPAAATRTWDQPGERPDQRPDGRIGRHR